MKLRNKKTGLVIDVDFMRPDTADLIVEGEETLKKLVEEWEDYEEPKGPYYIDCDGEIYVPVRLNGSDLENMTSIGNYFKTREEAEKAVEKLKAWKRLKDKGFEITGWDNTIGDDYYKPAQILILLNGKPEWDEYDNINDIKEELDLLFGGKE